MLVYLWWRCRISFCVKRGENWCETGWFRDLNTLHFFTFISLVHFYHIKFYWFSLQLILSIQSTRCIYCYSYNIDSQRVVFLADTDVASAYDFLHHKNAIIYELRRMLKCICIAMLKSKERRRTKKLCIENPIAAKYIVTADKNFSMPEFMFLLCKRFSVTLCSQLHFLSPLILTLKFCVCICRMHPTLLCISDAIALHCSQCNMCVPILYVLRLWKT